MKKSKGRTFKKHEPLYSNMEIKNAEREDPVTHVQQLTDEAVEEGRDWVEYLKL